MTFPLFLTRRSVLIGAALAALSVSACGRRGDLEPPPDPNAVQKPNDRHNMEVHRPNPKITPPSGSFALDPLLQ